MPIQAVGDEVKIQMQIGAGSRVTGITTVAAHRGRGTGGDMADKAAQKIGEDRQED